MSNELTKHGYDYIMQQIRDMKVQPPQNLTSTELKYWFTGYAAAQLQALTILKELRESNGR